VQEQPLCWCDRSHARDRNNFRCTQPVQVPAKALKSLEGSTGVLLVLLQVDSDTYVEPECPCGVTFCFRCAKDPHSPCTCKWRELQVRVEAEICPPPCAPTPLCTALLRISGTTAAADL
jgi:hypothetical protein